MLDTVKINHVQHISFTQSLLTDAVSVILRELLSYEHPPNRLGKQEYGVVEGKIPCDPGSGYVCKSGGGNFFSGRPAGIMREINEALWRMRFI